MNEALKKWLRPALFTVGGALAGLGYYYLVGCSTGSCPITSSPVRSMAYMALLGWLLSGILDTRLADVLSALESAGFTAEAVASKEEWRSIRAKRS